MLSYSLLTTIYLVTGNSLNPFVTFTLNKTQHGPVIVPLTEEGLKYILNFF